MRLLVIDHHDSYSHLLHHLFWDLTREEPRFLTADAALLQGLSDDDFDAAILSPGPGHPAHAEDFGPTLEFLRRFPRKPMLGICLGHQGMAFASGAEIIRLAKPWHGKLSPIRHDGRGLFAGLPQGFAAVRYHSLIVAEKSLPRNLQVTAYAEDDGSVQGIQFTDRPWHGLQFHPESIGTTLGPDLARRFLQLAVGAPARPGHESQAASYPEPGPKPGSMPDTFPASKQDPTVSVLPMQAAPEPLFQALRNLASEKGWAHFWLDPQASPTRATHEAMPGITKAWPGTVMGLARQALELYPWGLALIDCATKKHLATWRGEPLQGLQTLRQMSRKPEQDHGFSAAFSAACQSPLDWVGHLHYELGAFCQDRFTGWREGLSDSQCLGCFLLPDFVLAPASPASTNDGRLSWNCLEVGTDYTNRLQERLQEIGAQPKEEIISASPTQGAPETSLSRAAYGQAFARIQADLQAGNTYEACLTFTCKVGPDPQLPSPETAYLALRKLNPAPFGAYLATPKATLLASTPELFLSVKPYEKGMRIASRPIKGTRARGIDPAADAAQKEDLGRSPKDRAENLMITDLVRNDLARICEPGSVQVTSLQTVETHPRVFQMVSEVAGTLRQGIGLAACLYATFPGGSMTGAPKPRTLQILHELEGRPRGAYSGALGTLSADGSFTLAMVIRTWVFEEGVYAAGCGGAIVTDSQEESEWQEALLKVAVLRQALGERP